MACVLGDVVFIPYGPQGTKTYTTAKKIVEANIPAFTIDHPTSADLHNLGIPGFNRKTVGAFLEQHGAASNGVEQKPYDLDQSYVIPESQSTAIKEPGQSAFRFDRDKLE